MFRSMADPAFTSNPAALTGQGWEASIPGEPMASAGVSVGYFGLALTNRQRIRKNTDRLVRLHRRLLRVQRAILETESKLAMLGEDVDDIYDALGLQPLSDQGLPVPSGYSYSPFMK